MDPRNKKVVKGTARRDIHQERLREALSKKPSRSGMPVYELNKIIAPAQLPPAPVHEIRNGRQKRYSARPDLAQSPFVAAQKLEEIAAGHIERQVHDWLGKDGDWYLGFGGVGDALLVLAACYNNPNAKVVFFHNEPHFTKQWFDLFNVKAFLHHNIMGQKAGSYVYNMMRAFKNMQVSAHLADGLDYGDWIVNPYKYKARLVTQVTWADTIGRSNFNRPTVVIGPTGSSRHDFNRQRFLTQSEYNELVNLYLAKGYLVLVTGSPFDYEAYKIPNNSSCRWLTAEGVIDHTGRRTTHTLKDMLALINGATEAVSTDTWLKTYTLLVGIPTKCIQTRWKGTYRMIGSDATDGIFLNTDIWPGLENVRIEDLFQQLKPSTQ
jgi:hypothetical protein